MILCCQKLVIERSIEWKDGRLPTAASPLAVGKDDFSCMLLSLLCKGCYKGFNISAAVGNLWPSCLSFKPYICLLKSDYFYFSIYILVVVKLLNHLYFYIEMILKWGILCAGLYCWICRLSLNKNKSMFTPCVEPVPQKEGAKLPVSHLLILSTCSL